jgi:hypothetical protein
MSNNNGYIYNPSNEDLGPRGEPYYTRPEAKRKFATKDGIYRVVNGKLNSTGPATFSGPLTVNGDLTTTNLSVLTTTTTADQIIEYANTNELPANNKPCGILGKYSYLSSTYYPGLIFDPISRTTYLVDTTAALKPTIASTTTELQASTGTFYCGNITQGGASTFTTGTGNVTLNGVTTVKNAALNINCTNSVQTESGTSMLVLKTKFDDPDPTRANKTRWTFRFNGNESVTANLGGDLQLLSSTDDGAASLATAFIATRATGDMMFAGNVTLVSGKSLTMSGASAFTTGTGNVNINGPVYFPVATGHGMQWSNSAFTAAIGRSGAANNWVAGSASGDLCFRPDVGSSIQMGINGASGNPWVTINATGITQFGAGTFSTGTGNVTLGGMTTLTSTDAYTLRLPTAQTSTIAWGGTSTTACIGRANASGFVVVGTVAGDLGIRADDNKAIIFGNSAGPASLKIDTSTKETTIYGNMTLAANKILTWATGGNGTIPTIQAPDPNGMFMDMYFNMRFKSTSLSTSVFHIDTTAGSAALSITNNTTAGGTLVKTFNNTLDNGSGSMSLGGSVNAKAILTLNSTTQGFLPPVMTTAQKTAIAAPATGLEVYDSTLNCKQIYNGTAWVSVSAFGGTVLPTFNTFSCATAGLGDSVGAVPTGGWVCIANIKTQKVSTFEFVIYPNVIANGYWIQTPNFGTIPNGVYKLSWETSVDINCGNVNVAVPSVALTIASNIDCYSTVASGRKYEHYFNWTQNPTVVNIRFTVSGKNASSTDYNFLLYNQVSLTRVA